MSGLLDLSAGGAGTVVRLDRGRLSRRALDLAHRMELDGVRPGDRVALACDNSPDFVVGLLALMHLDVSVVLLDPTLRDEGLDERCAQAEVNGPVLCTTRRSVGTRPVLVVGDDLGPSTRPKGSVLEFGAWWRRRDALVVFSSGTTGAPCAIARTGHGLRANLDRTTERMGYRHTDVLLPLLPFSHQYGLSLVLLWWISGCSLVVQSPTALGTALSALDTCGVTVVDATPSTYYSLLRLLARRRVSGVGTVRMWCVGGAPTGEAFRDVFHRATGRPLLDGYGSSELGNIALACADDPVACGTALDGIELRVVDEVGDDVPTGTVGRVVVRSPDGMSASRPWGEAWQDAADIPLLTGDLGMLDAQGRLTVIGRARAVHRLGHTLYPEAVALRAERAGAQVGIVAVPDDRAGHRLVFVVCDPDGGRPGSWRDRLRAVLDPHEWPNQVMVLDRFPVGPTGKVDREALEEWVRSRLDLPTPLHRWEPERVRQWVTRPTRTVPVPGPIEERLAVVERVADHLQEHRDEIVALLSAVVGHRCAQEEVTASIATLRGAREEMARYRPGRLRSLAVFLPSNIPLYAYVLHLLVPSLYSERVVFRASSHIRGTSLALHRRLAPVHGLPIEASSATQRDFVTDPVAAADAVVFTGTYANAEAVRATLRPEQLMIFFGQGINPVVIGPDADVVRAATDVVDIRMLNNGQDCFGPDVVLVHSAVADRFLEQLQPALARLRYGPYDDPAADYGPLLYDQALGAAVQHLHRFAASIVQGGSVQLRERHLEPTVLRRRLSDKLTCDELFAPIFNVVTYDDEESLHRVLRSPFFEERAMGAMVYGVSPATVQVLAERHQVCHETTLVAEDDGNRPFGGRGIRANYVAIGGNRRAEPLLISKAVADHLRSARPVEASPVDATA